MNGDVTTVELAHLLQPFRIIFACNDGGILDKDNKAIPVVYMDKDYEVNRDDNIYNLLTLYSKGTYVR